MTHAERYQRRRRLEGVVLQRQARKAGKWLHATHDPAVYSPRRHAAVLAAGYCHWHRSFWRLVDPPVGSGDHWRRIRQGSE